MADDPCKVYVGGVPTNVTEAEIEDNFKKFGRVTDVVDTKKGFFFVTFNSPDAAKLALMGDVTFDGRRCKVEIARPKKPEYTDRDKFSRPEEFHSKEIIPIVARSLLANKEILIALCVTSITPVRGPEMSAHKGPLNTITLSAPSILLYGTSLRRFWLSLHSSSSFSTTMEPRITP